MFYYTRHNGESTMFTAQTLVPTDVILLLIQRQVYINTFYFLVYIWPP